MRAARSLWIYGSRFGSWLGRHKLECAILLFGVLLRVSMITNYGHNWNYDSNEHWDVVEWVVKHHTVPNTESAFESFHPPLWYMIAAGLISLGWTRPEVVYFSVGCGVLRLLVIWVGLELWLPGKRWARVTALALAAVLSVSVHLDGMIYNEPLSCLLHAILLAIFPLALKPERAGRLPLVIMLGLLMGFALLTKVSALVTLGALLAGAGLQLLLTQRKLRERVSTVLSFSLLLGITLTVCGWYYMQNIHQYNRPFLTSFNLRSQNWLVAEAETKPLLERRPLGFVLGWGEDIYKNPYRPAALRPFPRFFPVAVASSAVDYWGFGYPGYDTTRQGQAAGMRPPAEVREVARASVVGGTVVFFSMLAAGVAAAYTVWRRRDYARLAILMAPLFTLIAALHFAVSCPVDDYGVVKGVYLMFTAPPLFALFGLAVDWARKQPVRWPVLVILIGSLVVLGYYSVVCRLTTHFPWEGSAKNQPSVDEMMERTV